LFLCDFSDKVFDLKAKITAATNQFEDDKEQQNINWIVSDLCCQIIQQFLQDDDTLSDYEILSKIDPLLQLVCKVADNEYESVDIISSEMEDAS
jgi:hypothetical protein